MPTDYQDEWIPPPRESPDAWLIDVPGVSALASSDWALDDTEDDPERRLLTDGQIIQFDACDDHGTAVLTLLEDGGWTVSRGMPSGATQASVLNGWQSETTSDTVEAVVDALRLADAKPGEYTLAYCAWSGPFAFQFNEADRRLIGVACP